MKLTLKDGYGYAEDGARYWRDADGYWLRVIQTYQVVSVSEPAKRVLYRYGYNSREVYEMTVS